MEDGLHAPVSSSRSNSRQLVHVGPAGLDFTPLRVTSRRALEDGQSVFLGELSSGGVEMSGTGVHRQSCPTPETGGSVPDCTCLRCQMSMSTLKEPKWRIVWRPGQLEEVMKSKGHRTSQPPDLLGDGSMSSAGLDVSCQG